MTIRELLPDDWPSVRDIYAQGIATDQATLETSPPEWEAWDLRIIGYREKIGQMKGAWRDVNLLERRSKTIGIN